ncbi:MAG: intradiol ring-cleavage dioxygenase [Nitrospiraceae bacterium]|jgi:protocatechuate 3,4-dioxygenase beta subunit|uniref:intradiol ring-cleavage dioxygenase n=1 Tax=Nitrospira cf. moscoviensis SBR1015 TaxID=96242 RepID=UPI000A0BB202|nr:intradiol ring-cleavage dioxygenase [Nitrospira cf. moscoviensis SBR1015]MBY0248205.1 intradiol ring-cleavage dioxygenase [Nitrospiraceae bacterium]OQW35166.1 MAG: twin-arginine translocation pathway signal protein [Nitrospira sp. SG-bin2]
MEPTDKPSGHVLSRRQVVTLLGTTGALWLTGGGLIPRRLFAGEAESACIVRPEQMEGPYFVDERLHRSDIRSDPASGQIKQGTPLTLTFQVMRLNAGNCGPLSGAQVDIWHCDATGVYSDVQDPWFNTTGQKFLRGHQITDMRGEARFVTIYPGWYPGRTVHLHFKIRTNPSASRSFDFTSQLYFDDPITDRVLSAPPYAARGPRTTRNRQDWIFRRGGDRLMLAPTIDLDGYSAKFLIALQLS